MRDLRAFRRDQLGFLTSRYDPGGRAVPLRLGFPTLLVCDPDDVRHVFVANHRNYGKTRRLTSRRGRRLSGRGLLTSSGAEHRRRRRTLSPMFQRREVEPYASVAASAALEHVARWREGETVEAFAACADVALAARLRTLLSTSSDADLVAVAEGIRARQRWFERAFATLVPVDEVLPTARARAYARALDRVDEVLYAQIAARRREGGSDLLGALVAARAGDGRALSDEEIRDEALTLALTGHETIGDALAWTLWLVASHDALDERVARDDELARMVVAEALRLFPPTWIVVRTAYRADLLPSGARVLPGSKLYLSQWVMHRSPVWFPEPERFDPSRFTEEARRSRPRHAYFPFGAGPRTCIGEALAVGDLTAMLTAIVRRVRLAPVTTDVVPRPGMTLRARDGIRLRVTAR
jgi:cytochrome P450